MFAAEQWGAIYVPFIAQNGTLFNILVLSLLIANYFRTPPGATFEFIMYPIRTLLILLFFYAVVTTTWAPVSGLPVQRLSDASIYLVAILFIAPLLLSKPSDFTRMLDGVNWLGGAMVIAFAYLPSFEGRTVAATNDAFDEAVAEQIVGLPLTLATFAGVVAIVSVLRVKRMPIHMLWTAFVFISAMYLLAKTGSRGQFFFTLGAIMLSLPTLWKGFSINRVFLYCLAGVLIAITLFVVINTENTISSRLGEEGVARGFAVRFETTIIMLGLWSADFKTIIFGLGSSASWAVVGIYIHNVTLEVLAELGLIGFGLLSIAVTWIIQLAYSGKIRKQLSNDSARDFAALYGCWLLVYFISFKQASLVDSIDLILYAALLEKCVRVSLNASRLRHSAKSRKRRRVYS